MSISESYPISHTTLEQLVPTNLQSHRSIRYSGGDMGYPFEAFAPADRQLITTLYQTLSKLLALVQQNQDAPPQQTLDQVKDFLRELDWSTFITTLQDLGNATRDSTTIEPECDDRFSKVVHDVKSGGFVALSVYLQLIEMGVAQQEDAPRLFFLTRDHLKIMRNALPGIDPEREARDHAQIDHSITLLTEKWHHAVHQIGGSTAEISCDMQFQGTISESCLEFSALDRVLYNLINNAVRHTADSHVYLSIFGIPTARPTDVRFVVYNRVNAEQQARLQARFANNLGELFRGGFTTGGHGLGMRICADFVNNAYGIYSFDKGQENGYFGAVLIDDYFVNWVHWPIAGD